MNGIKEDTKNLHALILYLKFRLKQLENKNVQKNDEKNNELYSNEMHHATSPYSFCGKLFSGISKRIQEIFSQHGNETLLHVICI